MKNLSILTLILTLTSSLVANDHISTKKVSYDIGEKSFESTLVYSADGDADKPGILMVPNWMGPTQGSLEKAMKVAGDKYVVMMVDMYGTDVRPENAQEAGAAAGSLRGNRTLMRERAAKALEVFKAEAADLGLDTSKIAAIGFCFGGGTVLELGRSGADVDAVVSFHGDLLSPTLEADASATQAKVLVLHGADDPYVPQSDVSEFVQVMSSTDVDWQLVQYSDTVHSFTNPEADSDGSRYNETSARRSFAAMETLLSEIWR
ncbi:dienelactone hydrolase family protein [Pelagicoccus sp. SDUM812002]|uniref:dienelactone hydrolase family protein n=1 Tax=Pelagicoccus sp. SDUM812002 TaxID=3041266 RepID=UPI00280CF01B|nr:dienelactone hydrolase family protein [Pelagicoccus sp. SDUM812002]MDQ8187551.1 dienelactone hydrolase family protein [Pelagicoccus sp. SDUM812002]